MKKFPTQPIFYMFALPISFLSGYGFATSLWLVTARNNRKCDAEPNKFIKI